MSRTLVGIHFRVHHLDLVKELYRSSFDCRFGSEPPATVPGLSEHPSAFEWLRAWLDVALSRSESRLKLPFLS
jgi:hypothetical protein